MFVRKPSFLLVTRYSIDCSWAFWGKLLTIIGKVQRNLSAVAYTNKIDSSIGFFAIVEKNLRTPSNPIYCPLALAKTSSDLLKTRYNSSCRLLRLLPSTSCHQWKVGPSLEFSLAFLVRLNSTESAFNESISWSHQILFYLFFNLWNWA